MNTVVRVVVLLAVACALVGCATIFSGRSQRVDVVSVPPKATVIIVSGAAASVLKYGTATTHFIKLFGRYLSERDREFLAQFEFESILTALISEMASKASGPTSQSAQAAQILAEIPPPLKQLILEKIGISEFALAPTSPTLKRGGTYMVIGYMPEKKIALRPIKKDINWVVLWNVLNLGIGAIVDVATGAVWDLQTDPVVLDVSEPPPLQR